MKYRIKETGVELRELYDDYYEGFGSISKQTFEYLGLTLEPIEDKPKKLWAYVKFAGEMAFFKNDLGVNTGLSRAPDFDLFFGDKK